MFFLPDDDDEEFAASKRSMMHCLLPTASMQPRFLFNTCSMLTHPRIRFFLLDLDQVGQDKERRNGDNDTLCPMDIVHYQDCLRIVKFRRLGGAE